MNKSKHVGGMINNNMNDDIYIYRFFHFVTKYIHVLELVSLYVALPVSPGSEELLPSVSSSFSSSNGTPSVLTIEEVSNEAKDPAKARQDGVWLELPPLVSVVRVFSDGPLLTWPPSTEAAEPERRLEDPV